MSTKTVKINSIYDYKKLLEPAESLKNGDLVAFPTETVYGLGANALLSDTVKKVFEAKGRPSDNPLIVHVSSVEDVERIAKNIPPEADKIFKNLCPGPITVVLFKKDIVPDEVTAGGKTVAVRIPESEIARELIKLSGVPVAAPSANTSGRPSPTKAEHVLEDLKDKVEYIIDGGECRVGIESTVVDLTVSPPRILRPGGVSHETLSELLGEVTGYAPCDSDENAPKSPGMKYKHYAPKGKMTVFEGKNCRSELVKAIENDKKTVVLSSGELILDSATVINCGKTPEEYSKNLFNALRRADEMGAECILAELPFSSGGITTALKNRIYKSAGGNVVLCK